MHGLRDCVTIKKYGVSCLKQQLFGYTILGTDAVALLALMMAFLILFT